MPNRDLQQRAFLVADVVPDSEAEGAIQEIRAMLAGMRIKRVELDEDIAYGEALLAAIEQANAKNTQQ